MKYTTGADVKASLSLSLIFSRDARHTGFTKVTEKITKQKEMQDQLAQRHEALKDKTLELKRNNLDLESFVYASSHNLLSQTTNMKGFIQFIKADLSKTDFLKVKKSSSCSCL